MEDVNKSTEQRANQLSGVFEVEDEVWVAFFLLGTIVVLVCLTPWGRLTSVQSFGAAPRSAGSKNVGSSGWGKRFLKMNLTDGRRRIFALESTSMPHITDRNCRPGCKVRGVLFSFRCTYYFLFPFSCERVIRFQVGSVAHGDSGATGPHPQSSGPSGGYFDGSRHIASVGGICGGAGVPCRAEKPGACSCSQVRGNGWNPCRCNQVCT
mgnify:CR=1 FL=1